jgi:hypothetical protein
MWVLDGVDSGQGEVAGTCEYGNELSGSIKCGEFLDFAAELVSFLRRTLLHGVLLLLLLTKVLRSFQ